jgi:hypothetical protein
MTEREEAAWPDWRALQLGCLSAGLAGLALCAFGAFVDPQSLVDSGSHGVGNPEQFFIAYLMAFLFWLGVSLGGMALWMLHNQTGGAWGWVIRRLLEAATRTLPLLALLFLPLLLGLDYLYVWIDPHSIQDPHVRHLVEHKEPYLNVPFFLVRAVAYFAIWLGVAWRLNRWSTELDRGYDPAVDRRIQVFSGPGLVLLGLTITFAAVDWVMSLTPAWFSSIFGVLVAVGQILPAYALALVAAVWLAQRPPIADRATPEVWTDLGNLLLAFVMIWTYISFAQYLLIWSANLPEEITWYVDRAEGGWPVIAVLLAVFYFALPFVMLLSRDNKRNPRRLAMIAGAVALMGMIHYYWLIVPTFSPRQLYLHWMHLAAFVGVGGLWLAFFFRQLGARSLVPNYAPPLEREVSHA